jgi:hypothetical protein
MFRLSVHERREREKWEEEEYMKRKMKPPTKKSKAWMTKSIYGKTPDELSASYHDRVDGWVSGTIDLEQDPPINEAFCPNDSKASHHSRFRDRDATLEIGPLANGHFSASTYVPRAYYLGGGLLVKEREVDVDGPQRPATVSCEMGMQELRTTGSVYGPELQRVDGQGRIQQPPYKNPTYGMRSRIKSKELGPRMRYKPTTETDRLNEEISKQGVGYALYPHQLDHNIKLSDMAPKGGWRNVRKQKWKAGKFDATNAPVSGTGNLVTDVSHYASEPALTIQHPYQESTKNMARLRTETREKGPTWQGTTFGHGTGGGRYEPPTGRVQKMLLNDVNPTHTASMGFLLPGSQVVQRLGHTTEWTDRRTFGQSIRSLPSQVLM